MTLPDFQTMMRPLLESLEDDRVWTSSELQDAVAAQFPQITPQDRDLRDHGNRKKYNNLIAWGLHHFVRARIVQKLSPERYRITQRGHEVLAENPRRIDIGVCREFPEYEESKRSRAIRLKALRLELDASPSLRESAEPRPLAQPSPKADTAAPLADDYASRLQILEALSAKGLISSDELEKRRREILAEI